METNDFRKMVEMRRNEACSSKIKVSDSVCCSTQMQLLGTSYTCVICNRVRELRLPNQVLEPSKRGHVKISGGAKGKYYHPPQDYIITQREAISAHLNKKQDNYVGNKFPEYVLVRATDLYNQIQTNDKSFVRRGDSKDEILASIIYHECINEQANRKRCDVAAFMELETAGFSRGEHELRELVKRGLINIKLSEESSVGYAMRYLEVLEINHAGISNYLDFIIEIIDRSDELGLNTSSAVSSKVIGVIWFVIVKLGIPMTLSELEKMTEYTKRNTLLKFYKTIIENRDELYDIFDKHGIV